MGSWKQGLTLGPEEVQVSVHLAIGGDFEVCAGQKVQVDESSIIYPSTLAFCRTFAMIRQSFLRQRRCLIPHLPSRSISQLHSPFRSRHLDPLSSPSAKPLSLRLKRRWVSTETDAEAKANPDPESFSTRGEASLQQTQAEDPLKKELATKNQEIIDLKVYHTEQLENQSPKLAN
jgi:hypothetical protein